MYRFNNNTNTPRLSYIFILTLILFFICAQGSLSTKHLDYNSAPSFDITNTNANPSHIKDSNIIEFQELQNLPDTTYSPFVVRHFLSISKNIHIFQPLFHIDEFNIPHFLDVLSSIISSLSPDTSNFISLINEDLCTHFIHHNCNNFNALQSLSTIYTTNHYQNPNSTLLNWDIIFRLASQLYSQNLSTQAVLGNMFSAESQNAQTAWRASLLKILSLVKTPPTPDLTPSSSTTNVNLTELKGLLDLTNFSSLEPVSVSPWNCFASFASLCSNLNFSFSSGFLPYSQDGLYYDSVVPMVHGSSGLQTSIKRKFSFPSRVWNWHQLNGNENGYRSNPVHASSSGSGSGSVSNSGYNFEFDPATNTTNTSVGSSDQNPLTGTVSSHYDPTINSTLTADLFRGNNHLSNATNIPRNLSLNQLPLFPQYTDADSAQYGSASASGSNISDPSSSKFHSGRRKSIISMTRPRSQALSSPYQSQQSQPDGNSDISFVQSLLSGVSLPFSTHSASGTSSAGPGFDTSTNSGPNSGSQNRNLRGAGTEKSSRLKFALPGGARLVVEYTVEDVVWFWKLLPFQKEPFYNAWNKAETKKNAKLKHAAKNAKNAASGNKKLNKKKWWQRSKTALDSADSLSVSVDPNLTFYEDDSGNVSTNPHAHAPGSGEYQKNKSFETSHLDVPNILEEATYTPDSAEIYTNSTSNTTPRIKSARSSKVGGNGTGANTGPSQNEEYHFSSNSSDEDTHFVETLRDTGHTITDKETKKKGIFSFLKVKSGKSDQRDVRDANTQTQNNNDTFQTQAQRNAQLKKKKRRTSNRLSKSASHTKIHGSKKFMTSSKNSTNQTPVVPSLDLQSKLQQDDNFNYDYETSSEDNELHTFQGHNSTSEYDNFEHKQTEPTNAVIPSSGSQQNPYSQRHIRVLPLPTSPRYSLSPRERDSRTSFGASSPRYQRRGSITSFGSISSVNMNNNNPPNSGSPIGSPRSPRFSLNLSPSSRIDGRR